MSYAEKTFRDPNPIKRYFQEHRLRDAIALTRGIAEPGVIVDLGAGNGELCKRLLRQFPSARVVCYEPHPELILQARDNLRNYSRVQFCSTPDELPEQGVDLVLCLEVFEHLPPAETTQVLELLQRLLGASGQAVIGVPIETGLPALYKGLFRMLRRFGEFDGSPANIVQAVSGNPPTERPSVELMPGSFYYLHHLGFDHRRFCAMLESQFNVTRRLAGPVSWLGERINSELSVLVSSAGARGLD